MTNGQSIRCSEGSHTNGHIKCCPFSRTKQIDLNIIRICLKKYIEIGYNCNQKPWRALHEMIDSGGETTSRATSNDGNISKYVNNNGLSDTSNSLRNRRLSATGNSFRNLQLLCQINRLLLSIAWMFQDKHTLFSSPHRLNLSAS